MNALSSALNQTAIDNSYNALSEAYQEGLVSPAIIIANSTFESWIEHQLLQEEEIEHIYAGEDDPDYAFWGDRLSNLSGRDSYCSRLQEAETRDIITSDEQELLYDVLRIRDQIAHNSAWYTNPPLDSDETISDVHWQEGQEEPVESTIEDIVCLYEDVLDLDRDESILDQGRGNWEQEYLTDNHRSSEENILEIASQTCREDVSHPLNAAAGVIAYNFLENELPRRIEQETGQSHSSDYLEDWMDLDGAEGVLPETPRNSPEEFVSAFENLRMLFSHNIEAYSGFPNSELGEILQYGTETARRI